VTVANGLDESTMPIKVNNLPYLALIRRRPDRFLYYADITFTAKLLYRVPNDVWLTKTRRMNKHRIPLPRKRLSNMNLQAQNVEKRQQTEFQRYV
jgi:hypothetical protein